MSREQSVCVRTSEARPGSIYTGRLGSGETIARENTISEAILCVSEVSPLPIAEVVTEHVIGRRKRWLGPPMGHVTCHVAGPADPLNVVAYSSPPPSPSHLSAGPMSGTLAQS